MTTYGDTLHHILQVEDSEDDALLVRQALRSLGCPIAFRRVENADEMQAALVDRSWDLVISDHRLPRFDAMHAFELLRRHMPDVPFIIMSGAMPEESAAKAMRLGADDYIDKSNPARLVPVVERELRHARLRRAKERIERNLVHLTYHDPLTGLPNATMLAKMVEQSLGKANPRTDQAALVQLGLGKFRRINDSLGYAAGDALLKQVALRLADTYARDALVARLGQDNFALFFDRVESADAALGLARAVSATFLQPFVLKGEEMFVTCATGVGVYPDDGVEPTTLLHRAERAMFAAKSHGPGSVERYGGELDAEAGEQLRLESALRHAVPRNELFLLFQPFVDMRTRAITGTEALVRWRHPRYGVIGPEKFIRLADETGLIVDIGQWVLTAACRQVRGWEHPGGGLMAAVNVSAAQFRKPGFDREVAFALAETGLDPERLELEITETVAMQHAESTIATLRRLKNMGVRISIDDFGTGYSSLSYLKRFPIDTLKIDRSFLHRVTEDSDNQAIVRTIVAFAQTLKLEVVAEGVETAAQYEFLRELGCERAQGYYLGRPLLPEAFSALPGLRPPFVEGRPA